LTKNIAVFETEI